ncbi:hypothetical protein WNB94_10775 [Aquabacterium sp. A3]|uniref:hypothetical protein n=1 Tax=Aquabacterium sp. A3 TaxID=3132829 RepID=UPI003119B67E
MKKLFFVILALAMYVATSELNAKRKAEEFCDSIELGESTEGLMEAGIEAGASRNESAIISDQNEGRYIYIGFTGFMPGSSFSCRITDGGGVSIDKKIYSRSLNIFSKGD